MHSGRDLSERRQENGRWTILGCGNGRREGDLMVQMPLSEAPESCWFEIEWIGDSPVSEDWDGKCQKAK
jgi:hypothetical protein